MNKIKFRNIIFTFFVIFMVIACAEPGVDDPGLFPPGTGPIVPGPGPDPDPGNQYDKPKIVGKVYQITEGQSHYEINEPQSGFPIASATVNIPTLNITVTTDVNGNFSIENILSAGAFTLNVSAGNFTPFSEQITIRNGENKLYFFLFQSDHQSKIATVWTLFDQAANSDDFNYQSIHSDLDQIILASSSTNEEKSNAYLSKAWANILENGMNNQQNVEWLQSALSKNSASKDSRMLLAGVYLTQNILSADGDKSSIDLAITELEAINLDNVNTVYIEEFDIGITNAEAHAIIGLCYWMKGDETKSKQHLQKANEEDSTISGDTSSAAQIINTLQKIGFNVL